MVLLFRTLVRLSMHLNFAFNCDFLIFAAFLNETGLTFVKKCIELIETRGTPPTLLPQAEKYNRMFSLTVHVVVLSINDLHVYAGLTTPGLYRTAGVNSKVQRLMTTVFGKGLHLIYFASRVF